VKVHPNAAAEIDAKRLDDATKDYKRQEYLRKRDEWHNTPDTPEAPEMYHRHDAPPPDPFLKDKVDIVTDIMTGTAGGGIAAGLKKGVEIGAKKFGIPEALATGIGTAVSNKVDSILHDGWYNLNPHKDL